MVENDFADDLERLAKRVYDKVSDTKKYEDDGEDDGEGPQAWALPVKADRVAPQDKPKSEAMIYTLRQGRYTDEQIGEMTFQEAREAIGKIKEGWAEQRVASSLMTEKQRASLIKQGYPEAFVASLDKKGATALLGDRFGPKHSISPDQVSYLLKYRSLENLKTMSDAQAREAIYSIAISQKEAK